MPRNISGIYSKPAGTTAVPGTPIESTKYNSTIDDIAADLNMARPITAGGTGATSAPAALLALGAATAAQGAKADSALQDGSLYATAAQGLKADALSGRNLIINGSGRINQRLYVSGAATTGANQYTLDRWRVVTSGQNLAFTGTAAGRVMTAPAGGVEQVIEGASIVGGTYVISWTGTATCTVDGAAKTTGETFTLTANTNATVKFTGGTFSGVQVEVGAVPTVFEWVTPAQDEIACFRYYVVMDGISIMAVAGGGSENVASPITFPVPMRATPTMTWNATGTQANLAAAAIINPKKTGAALQITSNAVGTFNRMNSQIVADAEL